MRAGDGTFYLAARMREGKSPRGQRGYEIRILKSTDGHDFKPINHLLREDAGLTGFERSAIAKDPWTGKFKLYGCTGPGRFARGWCVIKFDDVDDPTDFDACTVKAVLVAEYPDDGFDHIKGYKDAVLLWIKDKWHMFVIGYDRVERIFHFTSEDGEIWQPVLKNPIMENNGWHNFYTRPASVVPMTVGYLFVYEGSNLLWHDPPYNIATGLAYSPDLESIIDLTPHEPLLQSSTPGDYHTWRYSHWMVVGEQVYVYYEAARPNNTNELRLSVFDTEFRKVCH